MSAKSEKAESAKADDGRERAAKGSAAGPVIVEARPELCMIAPRPGSRTDLSGDALAERIAAVDGAEVIRVLPAAGRPVVTARLSAAAAARLAETPDLGLAIESDAALLSAGWAPVSTTVWGGGPLTAAVQVQDDKGQPIEGAGVLLLGPLGGGQAVSGADGKAQLTWSGDSLDTAVALAVKPPAGYCSLWLANPRLHGEGVNAVRLRPLPAAAGTAWHEAAMGFDALPAACRGQGVSIGVIDAGTASGGLIAEGGGLLGLAREAELRACRLPAGARSSDLLAALDDCLAQAVDVILLGVVCSQESAIVAERIAMAEAQGIAVVAPAGSTAGPLQFPATSPHVLAVGALGRHGSFAGDSVEAAAAAGGLSAGELFWPAFSCSGPGLDVAAPGLAIRIGRTVASGTSVAAAQIAALAALLFAHHPDFKRAHAARDAGRVERLFRLIKETARPLPLPPATVGAGLPDARAALGLTAAGPRRLAAAGGLPALRAAMALAGLRTGDTDSPAAGGGGSALGELRAAMALTGLPPPPQ